MKKIKKPDYVPQSAMDYLNQCYKTCFYDTDGTGHYRHDIEIIENIITNQDTKPLWCEIERLKIDGGVFMENFDNSQNLSFSLDYIKRAGTNADDIIKQTRQLIKTLKLANHNDYFIRGLNELLEYTIIDKERYNNQRRYANRTREKAQTTFFNNKLAEFFKHKTGDTQDKLIVICASIVFKNDYFDSSRVTKSVSKTKSRL